jgi:Tol biopolymer transport system component
MNSKNVKILSMVCLCLGVSLPIVSKANEVPLKKELIALAANFQEILDYDAPVLSEDGKKIAWTIHKKPPETYFDPDAQENSANLSIYTGSKILMKEEGCDAAEISVSGGNSHGPSWSLDGKHIAYYSDVDGQKNLWVYDVSHGTNKKLSTLPVGGSWLTTKVVWASNHQEIYALAPSENKKTNPSPINNTFFSHFKSEEKSPDYDFGANQIVSININDGTCRYLTENDLSTNITSFSLSSSGNWITYITSRLNNDPSLKIHGIISDIKVVSADGKTQLSITQSLSKDFGHEIKCIWHPSLDRLYFIAKRQVWVAEFTNENLIACKPIQEISESLDTSTLSFTKDGQYLVVGADSQELYDYSIEHPTKLLLIPLDQMKPQSFALPERLVFMRLISNKKETLWQPSSDCIAFIATDKQDRSIKNILSLNLSTGDLTPLWKGKAHLKVIDFDPEHQMLYVLYENFTTSKEIFRYNWIFLKY